MSDDAASDDAAHDEEGAAIVRFPHSRVRPAGGIEPFKELGPSKLVQQFGGPGRQATGHWCSRCNGIWYGYLLECTCPVCGNRHG